MEQQVDTRPNTQHSMVIEHEERDTDESGQRFLRKPVKAVRTDVKATDVSEVSDSDFEEAIGGVKKTLQAVEEQRTAAITIAEEGQAEVAERRFDTLAGFDVSPG